MADSAIVCADDTCASHQWDPPVDPFEERVSRFRVRPLDVEGDEALAAAYAEGANDTLETFREEVAVLRALADAAMNWKRFQTGEADDPWDGDPEVDLLQAIGVWQRFKEKRDA